MTSIVKMKRRRRTQRLLASRSSARWDRPSAPRSPSTCPRTRRRRPHNQQQCSSRHRRRSSSRRRQALATSRSAIWRQSPLRPRLSPLSSTPAERTTTTATSEPCRRRPFSTSPPSCTKRTHRRRHRTTRTRTRTAFVKNRPRAR